MWAPVRSAGYLQETALLDQILDKALDIGVPSLGQLAGGPGGLVTAAVDAVGFTTMARQNSAIAAAISTVQHLQVANLALTGAGIGINVAGFAVLAHKLGAVEAKVDLMADKLDRIAGGRGVAAGADPSGVHAASNRGEAAGRRVARRRPGARMATDRT